jgi:hypothetical protein
MRITSTLRAKLTKSPAGRLISTKMRNTIARSQNGETDSVDIILQTLVLEKFGALLSNPD